MVGFGGAALGCLQLVLAWLEGKTAGQDLEPEGGARRVKVSKKERP